ncbi:MAG: hypothetical protein ACLUD2_19695 [Clostridium sp.]
MRSGISWKSWEIRTSSYASSMRPGTNGKGSVCADLTAMLMEAGYHVGTFVSPHLTDVTERFLVDGIPVEEAGFSESFARVKAVTDRLIAEG